MSSPRETRPSCGGGSCAACEAALGLDAIAKDGPDGPDGGAGRVWYCSPGCAQGMPAAARRQPIVAESRLYHRPNRFYGRRRPKELS